MFIETTQEPLRLAYVTAFADTDGFPTSDPTRGGKDQSSPVNDSNAPLFQGVVSVGNNFAEIIFFGEVGAGATGDSLPFVVSRILRIMTPDGRRCQWISVPVVSGTATLEGPAGVEETTVDSDQNYADSIVVSEVYDPGYESPTDQPTGGIASLRIDPKGAPYIQITFDLSASTGEGTGAPAAANAIVKTY